MRASQLHRNDEKEGESAGYLAQSWAHFHRTLPPQDRNAGQKSRRGSKPNEGKKMKRASSGRQNVWRGGEFRGGRSKSTSRDKQYVVDTNGIYWIKAYQTADEITT
jgi:hypothetical protein